MNTARSCIDCLNNARQMLPFEVLKECVKVISKAAYLSKDKDAENFIFLINWHPQQKAN